MSVVCQWCVSCVSCVFLYRRTMGHRLQRAKDLPPFHQGGCKTQTFTIYSLYKMCSVTMSFCHSCPQMSDHQDAVCGVPRVRPPRHGVSSLFGCQQSRFTCTNITSRCVDVLIITVIIIITLLLIFQSRFSSYHKAARYLRTKDGSDSDSLRNTGILEPDHQIYILLI